MRVKRFWLLCRATELGIETKGVSDADLKKAISEAKRRALDARKETE